MAHTIVIVQPGLKESRTYCDYDSVNEAMEGICDMFAQHLKSKNPNATQISVDIYHLFEFIDQLTDLNCLVYQRNTNTYAPYTKEWIKEKIYIIWRRDFAKDKANDNQENKTE